MYSTTLYCIEFWGSSFIYLSISYPLRVRRTYIHSVPPRYNEHNRNIWNVWSTIVDIIYNTSLHTYYILQYTSRLCGIMWMNLHWDIQIRSLTHETLYNKKKNTYASSWDREARQVYLSNFHITLFCWYKRRDALIDLGWEYTLKWYHAQYFVKLFVVKTIRYVL